MKMKSFAMLALTGLVAASVAYAPVMAADDLNSPAGMGAAASNNIGSPDALQTLADNSNTMTNPASPNTGMSSGSTAAPSSSDMSANAANTATVDNNNNAGTSSSDQGSPDTATGDDDY